MVKILYVAFSASVTSRSKKKKEARLTHPRSDYYACCLRLA